MTIQSYEEVCAERDALREQARELAVCLEACLPFVDIYRKQNLGDGDMTTITSRSALARYNGGK